MRYLLLLLVMSGCATAPSRYNIGCRDGIRDFLSSVQNAGIEETALVKVCNIVENYHKKDVQRK